MMRATLMHNPRAGSGQPSRDTLLALLRDAGYEPVYQSTKKKKWKKALRDPGDLVVAAGGDGTVAKVARRLVGRGVPMAILPLGTANNIAAALGIEGSPEEIVSGLGSARRMGFDAGVVRGPWKERRFLESLGVGVFTRAMRVAKAEAVPSPDESGKKLHRDLHLLQGALAGYAPFPYRVTLDGEDLSGEYLLVEAMNVGCIGPNLPLAPRADPGDGWLDVVLVGEGEREALAELLRALLRGQPSPPVLPVRRGRRLRIEAESAEIHADDKVRVREGEDGHPVEVDVGVEAHAVEFLLPG